MSSRILSKFSTVLANSARVPVRPTSLVFVRHAGGKGYWNPDWRADPRIPQTDAEKAAAAKKFNLHPDDYQTWSEDDPVPYGDYPKLPVISASERSPYEPWDYPGLRRNFGEPVPIWYNIYTLERCDTSRQRQSTLYMWSCFLGTVFSMLAFGWLTRRHTTFQPQMPKQYPFNDLWVERGGDPARSPKIVDYVI